MHVLEIDSIQLEHRERKILTDVYLKCTTGEIVGLLGNNGSGKSSLLKIAFGIEANTDYSIRIDGKSIKPAFSCPQGIYFLPQFNFIPAGMKLKNIFQFFGLTFDDFVAQIPALKECKNNAIGELSGGMRRLVECYLIIKKKGSFAFLDEPFTHLMPLHIEQVIKWINEEKKNKGFVITDHLYEHILSIANYWYTLHKGKTHLCYQKEDLKLLGYLKR